MNEAVSRTKAMSIVISSEGIINPPIEALVNKQNLDGLHVPKAYEDYQAWCCKQQCIPLLTRVPLRISTRDHTDVRSSQTIQLSSQKFNDEVWEEEALQRINQQGSQGSSLVEPMQM